MEQKTIKKIGVLTSGGDAPGTLPSVLLFVQHCIMMCPSLVSAKATMV